MARQAYKADVQLALVEDGGKSTTIDSMMVKYIMIEYLYQERHMPVIYLSLALTEALYTEFIEKEKTAKVLLKIQKFNALNANAISRVTINGKFTYIPSTSNPNYTEALDEDSFSDHSAYRTLTMALLSMDLINNSKTSFNGIYSNIDENTLILKALEGLKCVVKPTLYNPTFSTIVIPPVTSRNDLLKFFFQKNPFYDTEYEFFMDFDKSYLVDWSAQAISANDGEPDNIILSIQPVTSANAYMEGIEKVSDGYMMYINPANTNLNLDKTSDNTANQLVFVDDFGDVTYADLNVNNAKGSTVKKTFRRGGNANLYKNIYESNSIIIQISKENIDGDIFTPNKSYKLKNYAGYEQYDGDYSMISKVQVIKNNNGEFGMSLLLYLRKITTITPIGMSVSTRTTYQNTDAASRYLGSIRTNKMVSSTAKTSKKTSKTVRTNKKTSSKSSGTKSTGYKTSLPGVMMMSAGEKSDQFIESKHVAPLIAPERILPKVKTMHAKDGSEQLHIVIKDPDFSNGEKR